MSKADTVPNKMIFILIAILQTLQFWLSGQLHDVYVVRGKLWMTFVGCKRLDLKMFPDKIKKLFLCHLFVVVVISVLVRK